jgi:hypothetical protein
LRYEPIHSAADRLFDNLAGELGHVELDGKPGLAGDTVTPRQPHRGICLLPYFFASASRASYRALVDARARRWIETLGCRSTSSKSAPS